MAKKGRFIVHLYRSCPFEDEVASYIEKCSQEDIRHLLSQGLWLEDFIEFNGGDLSDRRFSGSLKEESDNEHSFFLRFPGSDSRLSISRIQQAWERVQMFNTFPGRLAYLRKLIFRGYLAEHAFEDKYSDLFSALMTQSVVVKQSVNLKAPQKEFPAVSNPDDITMKRESAKAKLTGLM
ncbi:hypothetical protein [Salinimonas iocasae]|uniref:Uncharacterized protein n=1 Tax=Salinimonas iocasae TaxID=2572577 RepID=A0A5B7YLC9_9ALTE|nr:hypothetical protein [Salinimonas iocasae]QCZ95529.1 hypothetical protein FBQ74_18585 [Salinimonas iocasae]